MGGSSTDERIARIRDLLAGYPQGIHHINGGASVLDGEWPPPLAGVYRYTDGAELFHETICLVPSRDVARGERGFRVGEYAGDDIEVQADTGAVWRFEQDTGEWLEEASGFDRWLLGAIEAEQLLYDAQGEYRDDVFDDDGELMPELVVRRERCLLKRDRHAPAPMWRLARTQWRAGDVAAARALLEQLVAVRPRFAWAWFDLARISEQLGELDNAIDEAFAAGDADTDHAAFFFAHAARLAVATGDEARRTAAAERALALDPHIVGSQREGAEASLAGGDTAAARELAAIAAALAPRDLQVIDLVRRLGAAPPTSPS